MIAPLSPAPVYPESLHSPAAFAVAEAEYRRLLGYPPGHEPDERVRALAAQTRAWYAQHGRPWRYFRAAELGYADDAVVIDGVPFRAPGLLRRLRAAEADRILIAAASAGIGCEERARALWTEGKPDEYFFMEMFGSAVVEALVAALNGDICALASRDGRWALPHYSPGYVEWDVADQLPLFRCLQAGLGAPLPERLEVRESGMLLPRKALLAVVGLSRRAPPVEAGAVPCAECTFSPCQYRRTPFRHAPAAPAALAPPALPAYRISPGALRKWAGERVALERGPGGEVRARFRFDGTTCSNLGQPLAFDYELELAPSDGGHVIRRASCRPAPGDDGYQSMCAYLNDADGLMEAVAAESPRPGATLSAAMAECAPGLASGCHCTAEGRAHKWSLALQAIHYALHASP